MAKIMANVALPPWGRQVKAKLRIHKKKDCAGEYCPFHNPSDHKMADWPINIRLDRHALVERICKHGVGHPDPDSLDWLERRGFKRSVEATHGCCGCEC